MPVNKVTIIPSANHDMYVPHQIHRLCLGRRWLIELGEEDVEQDCREGMNWTELG